MKKACNDWLIAIALIVCCSVPAAANDLKATREETLQFIERALSGCHGRVTRHDTTFLIWDGYKEYSFDLADIGNASAPKIVNDTGYLILHCAVGGCINITEGGKMNEAEFLHCGDEMVTRIEKAVAFYIAHFNVKQAF
jgi:hypothetical protein